ncbi:hypothetical protein [Lacinutrix sp. Hel_I_90]|uniref:hypothetical protein n=1 Tax=Lacinutrix sp. Hel_I_90 TaxID=1249999 RepID=UPI000B018FB8|nr:hypothetical protein [Lacinutrix sp. Hel_I_90]
MENRQLANEINSLKDTIELLISEIQYLRNDLEITNKANEGVKFRMSELENALNSN